jgi:hypothetical protein
MFSALGVGAERDYAKVPETGWQLGHGDHIGVVD